MPKTAKSTGKAPILQGRTVRLLVSAAIGLGAGIAILRAGILPATLPIPPGWAATGVAVVVAAAVAIVVGLRGFWAIAAALGPMLAALVLILNPPGWVFPVALVILAGLFWNVRSERVPLYLSNRTTQSALGDIIGTHPTAPSGRIVDLGCGFGGTTFSLARRFPDAKVSGVETAPLVFAVAWMIGKLTGPNNAEIAYRNLWKVDLSRYDAVYCFLSTEPMARLIDKSRGEMRPGAILISNSFTDPENSSDEVVLVGDARDTHLHTWKF